ncbi:CRTAC1 family protein [Micromonospora antibiotica]|uniref:CRTAC1 family protein n=1 Tax=Micromonospora antibiotica TaxID=2807623 RepID=A0ABS3V5V0_9ACTN|nr:CRTAC1 family protein [Micromonospora antibiotica]MBO4160965.1 CRTAC1 family protein [Micromonospora antibiotica]
MLVLLSILFVVAQRPEASAAERSELAARFQFAELPIALPPAPTTRTVREVNPEYEHIKSWVSSVGAAIALNDLDGNGVADDLCLVDTRSDTAVVTPAPDSGARYQPFVLDPRPLPTDTTMAPMGCVPGDYNLDGRTDLLVYYWGRTPVLFLHRAAATDLRLGSYAPTELIPTQPGPANRYQGALWNTNAVAVADFDGDGRPDIGVFNYFPDTQVLDPDGQPNVQMNASMSHARNSGGAHVLRWDAATGGDQPSVRYVEQKAVPGPVSTGWTLGAASADIDGDLLPELYLANDFGHDHLLHNVSTPGRIRFAQTQGRRGAFTPKSMVLGQDSFKGMSIDFGDLDNRGRFDMFVSNITSSWGLEESNFVWMNNAGSPQDARAKLTRGVAPYDNKASKLNMAWTGWGWDAKMADFDNNGSLEVVQADGFVKGTTSRWAWLQELAMSNDLMLRNPAMWPKAEPGDDIAGNDKLAFWVRQGKTFVNLNAELGLDVPIPTRGVAVADTNADGVQDFAVARQWGPPAFYRNTAASPGGFLGLRLHRPTVGGPADARTPAYGAQVKIRTADGLTQVAQLDGGGGHSGKRSFDVFFGLGSAGDRPVSAEVCWRDLTGATHKQTLSLTSGWHDLMLTADAQEITR